MANLSLSTLPICGCNPVEQQEVWDIIAAWVLKHPNDKIILIFDLNSAPAGERTGYSLPLSNSLRQADARLQDFCQDTGGDLTSSRHHSWRRGKQSASLDNAVTWNYPLSQPQVCPFEAKHKLYDHGASCFQMSTRHCGHFASTPPRCCSFRAEEQPRHTVWIFWHTMSGVILPFTSSEKICMQMGH